MQKTLDVLKNEDGLVIKRLSYKKLLLDKVVPIFLGDSDITVGTVSTKSRYRISTSTDDYWENGRGPDYRLVNNDRASKYISHKYGVKMGNVCASGRLSSIEIENEKKTFDCVIEYYYICDKVWIRDYLLKNLTDGPTESK